MSEKDLKIVRELFERAKENFERDGYLAPVLFAWAPGRPPTISLIEGNLRNILPDMCDTLRPLRYDRFALIVEGWVGRMGEHPKAQTSIQIIFVSPEETFGKFAVYDETEAGWVDRGDEGRCRWGRQGGVEDLRK